MMMINKYNKKRDSFFLLGTLIGILLWLISVSPIRMWASEAHPPYSWFFGNVPSFLAAWTFSFWMAYAVKSKPIEATVYSVILIIVSEFFQLYIPKYNFDFWDMLAGLIGALVSMLILLFREKSKATVKHKINNEAPTSLVE